MLLTVLDCIKNLNSKINTLEKKLRHTRNLASTTVAEQAPSCTKGDEVCRRGDATNDVTIDSELLKGPEFGKDAQDLASFQFEIKDVDKEYGHSEIEN